MRHISQVRDSDPQFQVFNLLLVGLVLNLDTSAVANKVELFLVELINLLEGHELVLFS